jgi:hypothetical protein
MCDADDTAEVIASYLQTVKAHEVAMLREAIVSYADRVGGDDFVRGKVVL